MGFDKSRMVRWYSDAGGSAPRARLRLKQGSASRAGRRWGGDSSKAARKGIRFARGTPSTRLRPRP
ncbi:hypothetical protein A4H34_03040 [Peptidiphaga gingivicola]|uniref:Uncharacterized protein n=1 Tax=Peptidiphaga gingivicola TaxID=2741497 RepID=A0A179B447_9ACTO|nr:hypothetical protein A4H34_03040 [Peptidiphaga gingivicola]